MGNGMMSLPPAELQWFQTQAQQGGGMPHVCPGIAAMTHMSPQEMQSHCTAGSEEMVALLPHGQTAIMLAQQPAQEVQSSLVLFAAGAVAGAAVVTAVALKKKRTSS